MYSAVFVFRLKLVVETDVINFILTHANLLRLLKDSIVECAPPIASMLEHIWLLVNCYRCTAVQFTTVGVVEILPLYSHRFAGFHAARP